MTTAPAPTPAAPPPAARAAGITLAGQALRIAIQFGSIVLLARLLLPEDYGLLAIVLVVVGVGEMVRDLGISTAAVQAGSLPPAVRDALFWTTTAIGCALCGLLVAASGLLSALFDRPQLTGIACALSVVFVLNGLATMPRVTLTRRMRFGALVGADVTGQATGALVAVAAAWWGAGYWSLVAQQLTQGVVVLIVVAGRAGWLPGRPRWAAGTGPVLRLGGHLLGTQLVSYASNNVDAVTIGLRFDPSALGLYNRGFQLLMTPLNQVRSPATTVALPVLSRLRDEPERFDEYLRRAQLALGLTVVTGLAIVAGAAGPLVDLLLGPTWSEVAPILALLAIAGAAQTLAFVGFWVYLSRGLGAELFRFTLVTSSLRVVCVLGGSHWGVVGVAAGYALAACLEWPVSLWWLSRVTAFPGRSLCLGALRILACAVPAGGASLVVASTAAALPTVLATAASLLAGVAALALAPLLSRTVRADLSGVLAFGRAMLRRTAAPTPPSTPSGREALSS
ncbi:lipopolysaccharide biosynthesis protein [Modestobacter roseus]|uniref:PST family polysaccharide transporter n=1 Tax=Modestobacter roseus TaxID=1181884 RepID=A0A562ILH2_9ACTN|nr:lipopolysaccharide biosynthesis protein [Modestobacter roseus]TWH71543.1 PST family polysaccharide transporter [Modestobacter roseus]